MRVALFSGKENAMRSLLIVLVLCSVASGQVRQKQKPFVKPQSGAQKFAERLQDKHTLQLPLKMGSKGTFGAMTVKVLRIIDDQHALLELDGTYGFVRQIPIATGRPNFVEHAGQKELVYAKFPTNGILTQKIYHFNKDGISRDAKPNDMVFYVSGTQDIDGERIMAIEAESVKGN